MAVAWQANNTTEERSPKGRPTIWRSIVETYATRILLIAIGFATTVIISRTLGPSGRGLFAVAAAIGAIGIQFGNLGLHASNTYYVAKDRELLPVLVGNTLAWHTSCCRTFFSASMRYVLITQSNWRAR